MADDAPTTNAAVPAATAALEAPQPPVVVKKYANRRLYNTETSSYITLDNLAEMIRAGRDFVVYDAKSGDDITRGVLTQIIVEEESKGSAMLPTGFLRQLIGFYGGNLQGVVPNYLEHAMSTFARQQQQMRQVVQQTFGPFIPAGVEEMSRQNMAMFDRAMSMFNPFSRGGAGSGPEVGVSAGGAAAGAVAGAPGEGVSDVGAKPEAVGLEAAQGAGEARPEAELSALRHEVDNLRAQLAIARAEAVIQTSLVSHEMDVSHGAGTSEGAGRPAAVVMAQEQAADGEGGAGPSAPAPVVRRQRGGRKSN